MRSKTDISSIENLIEAVCFSLVISSIAFCSLRIFLSLHPLPCATASLLFATAACICFFRFHSKNILASIGFVRKDALLLAIVPIHYVVLAIGMLANPFGGDDAWTNWNAKAAFLANAGDISKDLLSTYQSQYPLFLPSIEAAFAVITGQQLQDISAAITLFFSVMMVIYVYRLAAKFSSTRAMPGFMLLLYLMAPITVIVTWNQQADLSFALFVLLYFGIIITTERDNDDSRLWLAYFFLAATAWVKNEGFLFALAVIITRIAFMRRARRKELMLAGIFVSLFWVFIAFYKSRITFQNELFSIDYMSIYLVNLLDFQRYLATAYCIFSIVFSTTTFGIVFYFFMFLVINEYIKTSKLPRLNHNFLALALYTVGCVFILIAQPNDLPHFLRTFPARMVFQIFPALLLLVSSSRGARNFENTLPPGSHAPRSARNRRSRPAQWQTWRWVGVVLAILAVAYCLGSIRYNSEIHAIGEVDKLAVACETYKKIYGHYNISKINGEMQPSSFVVNPPVFDAVAHDAQPLTAYYISDGYDYKIYLFITTAFGKNLMRALFSDKIDPVRGFATYSVWTNGAKHW